MGETDFQTGPRLHREPSTEAADRKPSLRALATSWLVLRLRLALAPRYVPLWKIKHPYYCNEANWFDRDCHHRYASADQFLETFGGSDADLNYVVRWDWKRRTNDDDVPLSNDGTFYVFHVTQRKGFLQSGEFPVTTADEPKLRTWLSERWKTVQANWKPIAL